MERECIMLRIAVCDDKKENLDELCGYLEQYFEMNGRWEAQICRFQEGKDLLESVEARTFDAYFLDVLMPGVNGLDIGRSIRQVDRRAMIVYVTVSREFAFEAFAVRAFHYLEKPVKKEELFDVLGSLTDWAGHSNSGKISIRTRIGKYRDFRAMFTGFSAATYVLGGSVVSSVLYIMGAGEPVLSDRFADGAVRLAGLENQRQLFEYSGEERTAVGETLPDSCHVLYSSAYGIYVAV